MMTMTNKQIAEHEKDYLAAAERRLGAARIFHIAEKALAAARAELDKAERECRDEWRKLSPSPQETTHD
jgi:CHAD domain-containing protein